MAMKKYLETVKSDDFVRYEKEFADRILCALSNRYRQDKNEIHLVHTIEDIVNQFGDFTISNIFELSTKSIFIHGKKSHVQFKYYGEWAEPIELGDLIFIISIIYNKKKYFEKFTINQFKKDKRKSRSISWSIRNKKQLYLLSRFPTFRGVRGIIPKKNYSLPNYSGCLGSYGLLHRPGDFAFVSATRLDSFIGDKKTLKMIELYNLVNNRVRHPFDLCPIFYPAVWDIFCNCHFSHDVFSFVHQYLRMNIGEPVFLKEGIDNPQASNFLHELMGAIANKARKEGDKRILSFIKSFRRFPYVNRERENRFHEGVDFDGGGVGIVHTTIGLRE